MLNFWASVSLTLKLVPKLCPPYLMRCVCSLSCPVSHSCLEAVSGGQRLCACMALVCQHPEDGVETGGQVRGLRRGSWDVVVMWLCRAPSWSRIPDDLVPVIAVCSGRSHTPQREAAGAWPHSPLKCRLLASLAGPQHALVTLWVSALPLAAW